MARSNKMVLNNEQILGIIIMHSSLSTPPQQHALFSPPGSPMPSPEPPSPLHENTPDPFQLPLSPSPPYQPNHDSPEPPSPQYYHTLLQQDPSDPLITPPPVGPVFKTYPPPPLPPLTAAHHDPLILENGSVNIDPFEPQPPPPPQPSVQQIIEFLVENSTVPLEHLYTHPLYASSMPILRHTFTILAEKFKKLHKTKQEMTKYCMRKAFKFIADHMKKNRTHNRDVDTCMKLYFSQEEHNQNFTIPFKKNSTEKTMNSNFLKRVFSSDAFVDDYRQFLGEFRVLMLEDNLKKVRYLAELLQRHIAAQDLEKIEGVKRLPWTAETLEQTEQLGISLLGFAEGGSRRAPLSVSQLGSTHSIKEE